MIIGITGDYEKGKRELVNVFLSQGFSYQPLPKDFEKYYEDEKKNYFSHLLQIDKVLIDEFINPEVLDEFKSKDDFYLFGAHMPIPIKFFYQAREKLSKKNKNWEYYSSFFRRQKNENEDICNCLAFADVVFTYNSKNKSLESDIIKAYKKLL